MGMKKVILKQEYSAGEDRSKGSVLFGIIGKLIILLVLIMCLPVAVPKLLGYEVYNIVSGSMEPAIPVGSAIYTRNTDNPQNIKEGEIAVFEKEGFVVAHRVMFNDLDKHEIYTKGDANASMDMAPVEYQNIIGTVSFHISFIGNLMFLFTSAQGKIYLMAFLMGGILCNMVSFSLKHKNSAGTNENDMKEAFDEVSKKSSAERKLRFLVIIGIIIAVLFLIIVAVLLKIYFEYKNEQKLYKMASDRFVSVNSVDTKDYLEQINKGSKCPIQVNFDELKEINPEIIGWIYCEDTPINYPICYSGENDYYLNHAYDKSVKKSGAIFMEAANDSTFLDHNNIIYGHHMRDRSMFATLSYWSDQEYYNTHRYMWLLTPQKIYRIDLIAGYYTVANSDAYVVYQGYSEQLNEYIYGISSKSLFKADLEKIVQTSDYAQKKYIMLSTCEYTSENARFVLHGVLQEM